MSHSRHEALVKSLAELVHPVRMERNSAEKDYAPVLKRARSKSLLLIGDGSHGTSEFFMERAKMTVLIMEALGFRALALEWDFPDIHALDKLLVHTHASEAPPDMRQALERFGGRFPDFMWRTEEFAEFLQWIAEFNQNQRRTSGKVRLFGLDMYSLQPSADSLLSDLDELDGRPSPGKRMRGGRRGQRNDAIRRASTNAQQDFACIAEAGRVAASRKSAGSDIQRNPPLSDACADRVKHRIEKMTPALRLRLHNVYCQDQEQGNVDGRQSRDEKRERAEADTLIDALFNATVILDMSQYNRASADRAESYGWNAREVHMSDATDRVLDVLRQKQRIWHAPVEKLIIWAHNSHAMNAAATSQADTEPEPTTSVGQILRSRHSDIFSLGCLTYTGTVSASSSWGGKVVSKRVPESLPGSYELVFHEVAQRLGVPAFLIDLQDPKVMATIERYLPVALQRAIGAVFTWEDGRELQHHYLDAQLLQQFDMILFIDHTHASHLLR